MAGSSPAREPTDSAMNDPDESAAPKPSRATTVPKMLAMLAGLTAKG